MDNTLSDYASDSESEHIAPTRSKKGIFNANQEPTILNIHDTVKDDLPFTKPTEQSVKKEKKKKDRKTKGKAKNEEGPVIAQDVSHPGSVSIPAAEKDEFYDARESYHALAAEKTQPALPVVIATTALETHKEIPDTPMTPPPSENVTDLKTEPTPETETAKEPSIISKPTTGPA